MPIVDLLVTIVVVTILVTIILAVVTYIAYKLRLSREPSREEDTSGPQYFIPYPPPSAVIDEVDDGSALERLEEDVARLEEHAAEA